MTFSKRNSKRRREKINFTFYGIKILLSQTLIEKFVSDGANIQSELYNVKIALRGSLDYELVKLNKKPQKSPTLKKIQQQTEHHDIMQHEYPPSNNGKREGLRSKCFLHKC